MEKNKNTCTIVVGYHKEQDEYLKNDVLMPILMGPHTRVLGIKSDGKGDNISCKNHLYCELTGTYWLWKNVDAEIKGLFHYRRVLTDRAHFFNSLRMHLSYSYHKIRCFFSNKSFLIQDRRLVHNDEQFMREAKQFAERIPSLFSERHVDIIAPTNIMSFAVTNQQRFNEKLDRDFLELIVQKVDEVAPKYSVTFKETLSSTSMCYANIIVARNDIFDQYCNYVFSVLFEVEKAIIAENYWHDLNEKSLSRRFGYIGELLTSSFVLYCERSGLNVLKLPILVNA